MFNFFEDSTWNILVWAGVILVLCIPVIKIFISVMGKKKEEKKERTAVLKQYIVDRKLNKN